MATLYEKIINECEHDEDFIKRARARWKHFENDGYRKLSNILNVYEYHDIREDYTLYYYLKNKNQYDSNIRSALKEEIDKNKDNPEIDWDAIYAYFEERETETEAQNDEYDLYDEVTFVLKLLEPYKEQLLGQKNFVLY